MVRLNVAIVLGGLVLAAPAFAEAPALDPDRFISFQESTAAATEVEPFTAATAQAEAQDLALILLATSPEQETQSATLQIPSMTGGVVTEQRVRDDYVSRD